MAEYTQRGKRKCPNCKLETTLKTCPNCGRTTTGSGLWSVRFRFVENGKVVYKRLSDNYKTKKDAENGMLKFLSEHQPGTLKKQDEYIFDTLLKQFLENNSQEIKESSMYDKETVFKLHIIPYFTNKDISKLTKLDFLHWNESIDNLISEKTKKSYSNKYKQKIRSCLMMFLNFCEAYYDIPNLYKKLPKVKYQKVKKEMLYYDLKQFKKLQTVFDDILWDTFFNIQYYMGFRVGETIALTDSDINFEKNIITINKSLTRKVKGLTYKITTPKNISSCRDVAMPKIIIEKLTSYLKWKQENGIEPQFLFGGSKPLAENTYTRKFQKYSKLANLPIIRIHDLRHSHASLLINNGANVMLVSKRMGHSTPTETLNTYGKLFPSTEQEIILKLDTLN